jgi:putative DNA methylase
VSTDPPYYDNISYAYLSDFFYVWMRKNLSGIHPDLFRTTLVPKSEELIANPYNFNGDREKAAEFFENGLKRTFEIMASRQDKRFPITIFYAFKQTEETEDEESDGTSPVGTTSTGWETMLEGVIQSGLMITSTLPLRTERQGRSISIGSNALASSIVLSCRPRQENAKSISRRDYIMTLKKELPIAIKYLRDSGIAAVDLQQAAIGPAISVYSRYSAVLEADDSKMGVRSALTIINQLLDEVLTESDNNFDSITRWAIAWFEQYGYNDGPFGDANTLAQAKNISVKALSDSGIVYSKSGKVRLIRPSEAEDSWEPSADSSYPCWLTVLHLIQRLDVGGEVEAAALLTALGAQADLCRDLAYRCFSICEKQGWAQDAIHFNNIVVAWPELQKQLTNNQRIPKQGKFEI